jgi:type IV secretory pathway TraG/TraD family ATPase VirD4
MTWHQLTYGPDGLVLAWGLVAIPYWAGLWRGKASPRRWLFSPVSAAILMILAGLLAQFVDGFLLVHGGPVHHDALEKALAAGCFVGFGYLGGRIAAVRAPDHTHLRGTLLTKLWPMKSRPVEALTLAGVPIAAEDERKHFKLIGTTGTGKSTAIRELLAGALRRGDRAIIADPDGGYLERFHQPYRGDVILNPFHPDSLRWDPFAEIDTPYDIEQLVAALIPEGQEPAAREWREYARTFLAVIIRRCQASSRDLTELLQWLVVATSEELQPIVAGTPAQPFLAQDGGKMFASLRSVASSAVKALEYVRDQRAEAFSVRQWVRGGHGVLFLPYRADQIAALRGLVAAWMRIAIFEAMCRPAGDQRLWFVVDELDALGAIDGLKDALARLRKFGGRCVLGFQSIAQVSNTYGRGDAQTIVENCGNTLILRCSGSEGGGTARFASELIGEREVVREERSRGRHYPLLFAQGGGSTSSGVTFRRVREAAVMASEIEQLPDLQGFLKIASSPDWRRVRLMSATQMVG